MNSFSQNQNVSQYLNNQVSQQANGSSNGNHLLGMTQSAFGGFNFGMNINPSGSNSANNSSNLSFNRTQTIINRATDCQVNKGAAFDQQTSNKCWSVGKLTTRETLGVFGSSNQ